MSTPQRGDWVRLCDLRGVSSPAMRAQVGEVGTVLEVKQQNGLLVVQAAFTRPGGQVDDVFWLKPGEWELVATNAAAPAPEPAPATHASTKERCGPVADFATAVQKRIDQLAEQDAALAQQVADLARQRDDLARETKALAAAVAAYERSKNPSSVRALPARGGSARAPKGIALALVLEMAAAGGTVARAEAIAAGAARGVSKTAIARALTESGRFDRIAEGVYRPRAESAA